MTITITITAETASNARAEAAIIAALDLSLIHAQAPAATSPREATAYSPHLTFFGVERDALAFELAIPMVDRTDPAAYVSAAKEINQRLAENEGDSEMIIGIARRLGVSEDAELPAFLETILKLESRSFDDERADLCGALGLSSDVDQWKLFDAVANLQQEVKRLTDILCSPLGAPAEHVKRKPGRRKKDANAATPGALDPETLAMVARPRAIPKQGEPGQVATESQDDDAPSANEVADAIASFNAAPDFTMQGVITVHDEPMPVEVIRDCDYWIARIKNEERPQTWDHADDNEAARLVFGIACSPGKAITILADAFGIHVSMISQWMTDPTLRMEFDTESMDTPALLRALIRHLRGTDKPATLGLVVEEPAQSNVTEAF